MSLFLGGSLGSAKLRGDDDEARTVNVELVWLDLQFAYRVSTIQKAIADDLDNVGIIIYQRSGEELQIHFPSLAVSLVHHVFVVATECGRLTGLSKLL